eukprot:snap_masked-scaffold_5-processed-gene-12.21-mRNA-1 protein AED:1.00 eAED:1.00 QI:0/-1/0/0/-1/1/1/0/211
MSLVYFRAYGTTEVSKIKLNASVYETWSFLTTDKFIGAAYYPKSEFKQEGRNGLATTCYYKEEDNSIAQIYRIIDKVEHEGRKLVVRSSIHRNNATSYVAIHTYTVLPVDSETGKSILQMEIIKKASKSSNLDICCSTTGTLALIGALATVISGSTNVVLCVCIDSCVGTYLGCKGYKIEKRRKKDLETIAKRLEYSIRKYLCNSSEELLV